jgi:hypothetical protein
MANKITEIKIIDMSVAVESGIDCEFSDVGEFSGAAIGVLKEIMVHKQFPYISTCNVFGAQWKHCRIRQNRIHYHDGCAGSPIPNGLNVKLYYYGSSEPTPRTTGATSIQWSGITGFEVVGPADGYAYNWEVKV